ncbi:MAG: pyruvate:ferredoxin (flavodoxin) oxidoreductase [Acholeplasmatales bacterium]|nr:pyruvate:ferredoxin (flavodoxin) oxidoreductase [Acholeplasmataceae bacterium]MCK9289703.1 pyruvate:ferredoxin (flavodoxin) oxidoreductase [Acholeplasmataceae bacterium]MCK9427758.1 pyruvate:ferredoxin (flavodoxin) oxidoreductase [Acholeplasmataceae bacterium]MDY0115498.1 pyruvate:ferredoxin (flavodoxin) oxidoreductase [Acholeplasmatales bacterium]HHT39502.1 pyruvate:ferredoxin (flavodoxin) oxidoreductase [Acholeplasmataceae bacterium]
MAQNKKIIKSMDGNEACAYAAYAFTEVAGIYPITPSSPIPQHVDLWASQGMKNLFGMPVKVVEMQSEAGAIGTVHGSLQAGMLTTTFTASQGLLLKLPNMYKIAGQLLPGVIHVAARSIAAQSLSIFGDHQDVMAARQTGFAILATNSVQEVMDLTGVAHLSAIKTSIPFLHFFDGFRTSHEVNTIEVIDYEVFDKLIDREAIQKFRDQSLNPGSPKIRGSAQNDDVYFQTRVLQASKYGEVADVVNDYMEKISSEVGRNYAPFVYYGDPEATDVIVAMGSVVEAAKETIDYLNKHGQKVGILGVHLYRPFSEKYFFNVIPETVERISVLDRTIEPGSLGEPLYLDVKSMYYNKEKQPRIIGGIYGLSSKDTTPTMINAIFKNLRTEQKDHFTVGIKDDVSHTSLDMSEEIDVTKDSTTEIMFYGLGGDGTVGASKNIVKIIGDNTKLYSQAYASYDSKKAGSTTRLHVRFSPTPILSTYLVHNPHFVSCANDIYLEKLDMLKGIRKKGTFLLNTQTPFEDIEAFLPNKVKRQLAEKEIKFYVINAADLAYEIGLGRRTNTIMQSAFFKLNEQLMPYSRAVELMKDYAKASYGRRGEAIVKLNYDAIDAGGDFLKEVKVKEEWKDLKDELAEVVTNGRPDFVKNIADIVNKLEGDSLPVSAFEGYEDGHMTPGSAAYEKRGIANFVPEWIEENCIQCNQCVFACPHAVIRAFLADDEEVAGAPEGAKMIPGRGRDLKDYQYTIQVSTLDCTECGVCVEVCPAPNKALKMVPVADELEKNSQEIADYFFNEVTYKNIGTNNVKNVNFNKSLFEFSGACAGCGETPYIKAVTQLFGERLIVANATGCSSIFGASFPSTPYTTLPNGRGPAWANSLFEDNAEFGFGMRIAYETARDRIQTIMADYQDKMPQELKELTTQWTLNRNDGEKTLELNDKLVQELEKIKEPYAQELLSLKGYFIKTSQWIFGGDGWAYDIGYGGIDHVIANNEDVNILVLDTEVYSNTGGQSSKAAPHGSIAKFTAAGKPTKKKDLAALAMSYGHVYVAQISHGASPAQVIRALKEAESYPGPSLVIAYSPCIEHGIKGGLTQSFAQAKLATECGYWPTFRYDPRLLTEGKNPLQLDSKVPVWDKYQDYLLSESRYAQLTKINPEHAEELLLANLKDAKNRWNMYERMRNMDYSNYEV